MGRVALIAPTASDVRDVMIEGESGILATSPPWFRPQYEPSKRRLTWPNGAIGTTYSADEPDRLRGPQHDGWWGDEFAAWRYGQEAYDMLQLGLRLGERPRGLVTTTPRRVPWLIALLSRASTHTTTGTTYENLANLAPAFHAAIVELYEGTRLGRQELYAELLLDVEGALWQAWNLDTDRVPVEYDADGMLTIPPLSRVVVGVDPPATSYRAECGIVVAGRGTDGHGYVLADASLQGSPDAWGTTVIDTYHAWGADAVVIEDNQGGDMAADVITQRDPTVRLDRRHAAVSKKLRAAPVAALYEQHKVHHVGRLDVLENQQTTWDPDEAGAPSPDRVDALVWAITCLMITQRVRIIV
jgi:phage terminase large subunit-like protein